VRQVLLLRLDYACTLARTLPRLEAAHSYTRSRLGSPHPAAAGAAVAHSSHKPVATRARPQLQALRRTRNRLSTLPQPDFRTAWPLQWPVAVL
jgi:hypothetical protein